MMNVKLNAAGHHGDSVKSTLTLFVDRSTTKYGPKY